MPWINTEMCDGCETCVEACSVGAITMVDATAVIDDGTCIRCAVCHDVCPSDAVRHDGERIPDEVAANLAWARSLIEHEFYAGDRERQRALIDRLQRYFTKNIRVMEKTVERLGEMRDGEYAD